MIRIFATLLCLVGIAGAELIPADRLTDWTPNGTEVDAFGVGTNRVGVPGGIDRFYIGGADDRTSTLHDVTQPPYNADNTGATNAQPAIQAAYAATGGGLAGRIYLPAGTYRLDSPINIPTNNSHVTIRGAGMGQTILAPTTGNAITFAGPGGLPSTTISAGLSKGSTLITVADTSEFVAGQLMLLEFEDERDETAIQAGAVPIIPAGGRNVNEYYRKQIVRVIGKSVGSGAGTITFSPGIYHAPRSGLAARAKTLIQTHQYCGIEDLTIDMASGTTFGVTMEIAYACWVRNVEVKNLRAHGIYFDKVLNCEIRGSYAHDRDAALPNGSGIQLLTAYGCLVEDNIVRKVFPNFEINNSSGNVFAFNLCDNEHVEGYGIQFTIDTNHLLQGSYNLYEGNVSTNLIADGYFGGVSEDTIFRNWLHRTPVNHATEEAEFSIALKRFTRNYNILGNVLGKNGRVGGNILYGHPNIGNFSTNGNTVQPTAGIFWPDWTTPTGIGGWQELDLDVQASTIEKGNYSYGTDGAAGSMSGLGGDALPSSMFRSSKPAFFGALAWPPIDPTSPDTVSYSSIPAGKRYIDGTIFDGETPAASGGKRTKVGGKEIRIGGKTIKIGNN